MIYRNKDWSDDGRACNICMALKPIASSMFVSRLLLSYRYHEDKLTDALSLLHYTFLRSEAPVS